MKNPTTHPRKRKLFGAALTLAALLGALGLSSCAQSTRDAYRCSTRVTIDTPEPVKLSDFARDTRPRGTLYDDWRQLVIERNHFYADTLRPGQAVQLPLPCKKD